MHVRASIKLASIGRVFLPTGLRAVLRPSWLIRNASAWTLATLFFLLVAQPPCLQNVVAQNRGNVRRIVDYPKQQPRIEAPAPTISNSPPLRDYRPNQQELEAGRYDGLQPQQYQVNPSSGISRQKVQIKNENGLVTLVARNAALNDVLNLMADEYQLSFAFSSTINTPVSISLRRVPVRDALTAVLSVGGYTWTEHRGIILVSELGTAQGPNQLGISPETSGRIVRVFPLDFVSAEELDKTIKSMLSPLGTSHAMRSDPLDNRKTRESVVVEDIVGAVSRIEQYINQIDVAPRQVMIDVHVLEIKLNDNEKHGIQLENLTDFSGNRIKFGTLGDQPSGASTFFAELDTGNLQSVLQALQTTVDSRTLASTKLLALNGQQARLQVGQQLGFRVLTTTQTSTLEEVQFLDLGVVLHVTPRISRDGRIMLAVRPEVSSGQINPQTGLPEEETSEVETNVMLEDGKGMIIGGLIQEKDIGNQRKVPRLGDLPGLGRIFRNTEDERQRSEVIFVLLPRIIGSPHPNQFDAQRETMDEMERIDGLRAMQRVLDQRLNRLYREMDPRSEELRHQHADQLNEQAQQRFIGQGQHVEFGGFHGGQEMRGQISNQEIYSSPYPQYSTPSQLKPAYQQPQMRRHQGFQPIPRLRGSQQIYQQRTPGFGFNGPVKHRHLEYPKNAELKPQVVHPLQQYDERSPIKVAESEKGSRPSVAVQSIHPIAPTIPSVRQPDQIMLKPLPLVSKPLASTPVEKHVVRSREASSRRGQRVDYMIRHASHEEPTK